MATAPSLMKTANTFRVAHRSFYICHSCRRHLRHEKVPFTAVPQQRWISAVHVRRIQEAEQEWRAKAKNIEKGNMKSMLTILEERGLVNQIVGYDALQATLRNYSDNSFAQHEG